MSRKQSREVTYRLLFSLSIPDADSLSLVCAGEEFGAGLKNVPTGPELEYVKCLCAACIDNLDAIDEIIKCHSKGFAFDRIFKTDLTALRMGIAEIKFFDGKTPPVVAVNEAIEIAKKYGTEKSGGFVNGILAAVIVGADPVSAQKS